VKILGIPALTPEWFARRREGLTATDAVKVLGVSPYGTALDVWAEKTGKLEAPVLEGPHLEWGNRTEEMHRRWVAELQRVAISCSPGLVQDAEFPWLLATPDGLICDDRLGEDYLDPDFHLAEAWRGVWEAKAPSPYKRGEWEDGVPLPFQVQVQVQLRVTGLGEGLCSQLQWPGVDVHRVERSDRFIEGMVEELQEFWEKNVQRDIPPEVDGSDIGTLKRLYGGVEKGRICSLPERFEPRLVLWEAAQDQLALVRQKERELVAECDGAKAEILAAMGEAEFAVCAGSTEYIFKRAIVNRKAQPATTFQTFRRVKEIK